MRMLAMIFLFVLCTSIVSAAVSDIDITGTLDAASYTEGGTTTLSNDISGSAGDLNCENCIGTTEITDSYVLNSGDTMQGSLTVTGTMEVRAYDNSGGQTDFGRSSGEIGRRDCSSIELKTDVQDLGWGLETVHALRPVEFTWIETGEPGFGFIAEEVEAYNPLLVMRDDNDEISVYYSNMNAILAKAIQQSYDKQQRLRAELEALNEELDRLEAGEPVQMLSSTEETSLLQIVKRWLTEL